jgi:hypothetical protein
LSFILLFYVFINISIAYCLAVLQILVLRMKWYSEHDLRTCLGVRFGGDQGGMTALLSEENTDQLFNLNQDPLSQGILEGQSCDMNPASTGTPNNNNLTVLSQIDD